MHFLIFHVNKDKTSAVHAAYFILKKISFRWQCIKIRVHGLLPIHRHSFHLIACFSFTAKEGLISLKFRQQKIIFSMNKYLCKIHQPKGKFCVVRPDNHCKERTIFVHSLEPWTDKDCQLLRQAKLFFPEEGREMHSARQLVITSQRNFDMFKSLWKISIVYSQKQMRITFASISKWY